MPTNSNGAGIQLFMEKMGARDDSGGNKFDPTIILLIISAIIPLIQGCFKPKPSRLKQRLGNRVRLAIAILNAKPDLGLGGAFHAADRVFDVAGEAADDEIQIFIDDCIS